VLSLAERLLPSAGPRIGSYRLERARDDGCDRLGLPKWRYDREEKAPQQARYRKALRSSAGGSGNGAHGADFLEDEGYDRQKSAGSHVWCAEGQVLLGNPRCASTLLAKPLRSLALANREFAFYYALFSIELIFARARPPTRSHPLPLPAHGNKTERYECQSGGRNEVGELHVGFSKPSNRECVGGRDAL
jgi:hypothetical protein